MRFILRLFLLVLVVGLVWTFRAPILDRLGLVAGASSKQSEGERLGASGTAQPTARGRLADRDFSVETIPQELRATGRVVRRKVVEAGQKLEESTRDARTTAKLKARFALDPQLKTREIDIDTDDGRVTLKGRVESHEEVARAIRMAVEEAEVVEVTSTLQVSASGPRASGVEIAPLPAHRTQPKAAPLP